MPLTQEQLDAEAARIEADFRKAEQERTAPPPGDAPAPGDGWPEGDAAREGEHLANPGPKIAAAIIGGREAFRKLGGRWALLARLVPPHVVEVFDDETANAIGDAFGPLVVKYAPRFAGKLGFLDEWKDELRGAGVAGVVALRLYAAFADPANAARDVTQPDAGGNQPKDAGGADQDERPKTDGPAVRPVGT